jgi:Tfp pilus assembly protein PilN
VIEVNLHPDRGRARRGTGRRLPFSLPTSFPSFGGGQRGGRDIWTTLAVALPVLVLLVVGWLWFSQRSERGELEARLEGAVEDSTRLSDLRSLSDSLTAREARIGRRLELVQSLDDGRFVWPHLLDEIGRAVPSYTWLTALRQNSAEPRLQVQVDGLAANPLAITEFVRNLQGSPYVGEVRILGSQQELVENVAAQAFKLMIVYDSPPPETARSEAAAEGL